MKRGRRISGMLNGTCSLIIYGTYVSSLLTNLCRWVRFFFFDKFIMDSQKAFEQFARTYYNGFWLEGRLARRADERDGRGDWRIARGRDGRKRVGGGGRRGG